MIKLISRKLLCESALIIIGCLSSTIASAETGTAGLPMTASTCPTAEVYIRIDDEIRGYPSAASGSTAPCADIVGSLTGMSDNYNGLLAISDHGFLHTVDFQPVDPKSALHVYSTTATGNVSPLRNAGLFDRDGRAIAVEQNGASPTDYIVSGTGSTNCYWVVRANATMADGPPQPCDQNLQGIQAAVTNSANDLIVAGLDAYTGVGRVDVLSNPATSSPTVIRTIMGSKTGLATGSYFSIAADQATGLIYVYSSDGTTPKILEFSGTANGNVAPLRVISGSKVGLPTSNFNASLIGLDASHNLYVNETGVSHNYAYFAVFDAGVSGNVAPNRTFYDSKFSNQVLGSYDNGSIAVHFKE